ncbi:MAG: hypothetical protein HQ538_02420 [Parcubacteria group bacterium]|nr:hypothetical protein [Parcubacteria group bacterium]
MSQPENKPGQHVDGELREINSEVEEVKEVVVKPSVMFKLTASDKVLRLLMGFMQDQGILTQHSVSESRRVGSKDRIFLLWVDGKDEDAIQNWLKENEFTST